MRHTSGRSQKTTIWGCAILGVALLILGALLFYANFRRSEKEVHARVTALYSRLREGDYTGLSGIANPHLVDKFRKMEQEHGRVASFTILDARSKFPDTPWEAEISVQRKSRGREIVSGSNTTAISVVRN